MRSNMKQLILSLIVLFAFQWHVGAQTIERSVIASAGGEQTKTGISISSTVGEPAILTLSKTSLVITQGFQQPSTTAGDGSGGGGGGVTVEEQGVEIVPALYPNPTHSSVQFTTTYEVPFSLNVFDAAGKLVYTEAFDAQPGTEQTVEVEKWERGTYHFLFVDQNNKQNSFKVVKQ